MACSIPEEQKDELEALGAILEPGELVVDQCGMSGVMKISIEISSNIKFVYMEQPLDVIELPQFNLKFSFPIEYPISEMPDFDLECLWISKGNMDKVAKKLQNIWIENGNQVVLFCLVSVCEI